MFSAQIWAERRSLLSGAHMFNLGNFLTNLDFEREVSRNGTKFE